MNKEKSFIQLLKDNNHQGNICCEGCFRLGKEEAKKEFIKILDENPNLKKFYEVN